MVRPEPIQVTTCLLCNPAEHARLKRVVWILKSCKKTKYCQRHNGLVSFMLTKNHTQIIQAGTKMSNSSCQAVVSYQAVTCHQAFEYNLHASINISSKLFLGSSMTKVPTIKFSENRSRCKEFVTNKARQMIELGRGLIKWEVMFTSEQGISSLFSRVFFRTFL